MYEIAIFRSVGRSGSVVLMASLATLHTRKIPSNLDDIIDDLDGDFCTISDPCEKEHPCVC
jgi:hypothetical protein